MRSLRPKRRTRPCVEVIEPRDPPAGLELGGLAAAIGSSPVLGAARTAVLAYKAGQLAYTGHTNLLFGAVRVSQPFALRNIGTGSRSRVAPVSIRHTVPSGAPAPAGEREGGHGRHGHSATTHKRGRGHGHGHGHRGDDHGHHRGWGHGRPEHERGRGHGGDDGD